MSRLSLAVVTLASWIGAAQAQTHEVGPELWDRPRTADAVARDENVRRAVTAIVDKPEAQLVIHHASGQETLMQAEELKSWLAALAIDPRRIALRSDLAPGTPIRLEVLP
jgi:hypothetical protein